MNAKHEPYPCETPGCTGTLIFNGKYQTWGRYFDHRNALYDCSVCETTKIGPNEPCEEQPARKEAICE
jgi:hypothetical protein